jgi:hypothetical protein
VPGREGDDQRCLSEKHPIRENDERLDALCHQLRKGRLEKLVVLYARQVKLHPEVLGGGFDDFQRRLMYLVGRIPEYTEATGCWNGLLQELQILSA